MIPLKFLPGPRLLHQAYPMPAAVDVVATAHRFLFDIVDIDAQVTLGDVFGVFAACPTLVDVFTRDWAQDLLEEALKGPLPDPDGDDQEQRIEYLELYGRWSFDTSTQTFDPMQRLSCHGVGPVLGRDAPEHHKTAGSRIEWGISCANLRQLLPLPIRVRTLVNVCESDFDAVGYGEVLKTVTLDGVTFGQVIQGLLWELAFHGGPKESTEVNESLKAQIAEIDSGRAVTTSADDLFDGLDRPGCEALFDAIGDRSPSDIGRALRTIPDDGDVVAGLQAQFGDAVVVKPAFSALPGRAFRKAFRMARRVGDAAEG